MKKSDDEAEWKVAFRRKLTFVGVILAVLLLGYFGYRWISRDLGTSKVGSFYKQADEIDK